MSNNQEIVEKLLSFLREQDPNAFIGSYAPNAPITIDGRFDLTALVQSLSKLLLPTEQELIHAWAQIMDSAPYALWHTFDNHTLDKHGARALIKELANLRKTKP